MGKLSVSSDPIIVVSAFGRTDLWPASLPARIFDVTSCLTSYWSGLEPFNIFKDSSISDETWSLLTRRLDLKPAAEDICLSLPSLLAKPSELDKQGAKQAFSKGLNNELIAEHSVYDIYQKYWLYALASSLPATKAINLGDWSTWSDPLSWFSPCYELNPRRSYQKKEQDLDIILVDSKSDLEVKSLPKRKGTQLSYKGQPLSGKLVWLLSSFETSQILKSNPFYHKVCKPKWSWKKVVVSGVDEFCPVSYFLFIDNPSLDFCWDNGAVFKKSNDGSWSMWIKTPCVHSLEQTKEVFSNLVKKVEKRWCSSLSLDWQGLESSPFVAYDNEVVGNVKKPKNTLVHSYENTDCMDMGSWHLGLTSLLKKQKYIESEQ